MASKAHKTPDSPAEIRRRKQLGRIHILKKECEEKLPQFDYQDQLWLAGKVHSAADLNEPGRIELIQRMEELLGKPAAPFVRRNKYPGRPHNMDKAGSRADQLGKIEALLTVGGKEWHYADTIAKQMRLADKVAWVKTGDLYKIITALRKQAKREGWDLSGETK